MSTTLPEPHYAPPLHFLTKIKYYLKIISIQLLLEVVHTIRSLPGLHDNAIQPTFVKSYKCNPKLKHRVFIPHSWKSGDSLLPLYLDIHGGGFCIGRPQIDDKFCSHLSKNGILVVSLDYPLSPQSPYPGALRAVVDLIQDILADETLPFDKRKVAIGGFSAGGNLALAVSQDDRIRSRIGGIVSFYPATNFLSEIASQIATRPKHAGPDMLEHMAPIFNWAYIPPGQDLRDPQLSVALAARDKLPPKIYILGCELDLLCHDAMNFAKDLAGEDRNTERGHIWRKNGIKWELIEGFEHGFDQIRASTKEQRERCEKRASQMYDSAVEWLFSEVYGA